MKLNKVKVQIAMANACLNAMDVCEKMQLRYMTFRSATNGNECKPATAGKIAKALNVPVQDLLED